MFCEGEFIVLNGLRAQETACAAFGGGKSISVLVEIGHFDLVGKAVVYLRLPSRSERVIFVMLSFFVLVMRLVKASAVSAFQTKATMAGFLSEMAYETFDGIESDTVRSWVWARHLRAFPPYM